MRFACALALTPQQVPGGTAEWMAPEVMEGAPYNQSVDVYSYGIVLSE